MAKRAAAAWAAMTSLMSSRSACLANFIASGLKNRTGARAWALFEREFATGPAWPICALIAAPSAWMASASRCRPGTACGRIQIWPPLVRPPLLTAQ